MNNVAIEKNESEAVYNRGEISVEANEKMAVSDEMIAGDDLDYQHDWQLDRSRSSHWMNAGFGIRTRRRN